MNAIVFSFTPNRQKISLKLQKYLNSCGFATGIFYGPALPECGSGVKISPSLLAMCKRGFFPVPPDDFISATGIAIRNIALLISGVRPEDPAVISIDEQGKFVIPLLSGHIDANGLAAGIAAF